MAVVKCREGHFFDNEKYSQCPHCADDVKKDAVTMAMTGREIEDYAVQYLHKSALHQRVEMDRERTIGIYSDRGTGKFVAGWLVCIEGPSRGSDYRIYAGFNRIGRGTSNDIVLREDMQTAREEHCSVVYEEKKNQFYVVPKSGNPTYLNGTLIDRAVNLSGGEIVKIGESSLEFVSFCRGEKRWK